MACNNIIGQQRNTLSSDNKAKPGHISHRRQGLESPSKKKKKQRQGFGRAGESHLTHYPYGEIVNPTHHKSFLSVEISSIDYSMRDAITEDKDQWWSLSPPAEDYSHSWWFPHCHWLLMRPWMRHREHFEWRSTRILIAKPLDATVHFVPIQFW